LPPNLSNEASAKAAGDLDTIAETATRQEPDRRYPSVDKLSSDIARHLASFPIAARPDRWSCRALLSMFAGTAGAWQRVFYWWGAVDGDGVWAQGARRNGTPAGDNDRVHSGKSDRCARRSSGPPWEDVRSPESSFHSLRDLLQEAPNDAPAIGNYAVLLLHRRY
jgi:hypothetical protein